MTLINQKCMGANPIFPLRANRASKEPTCDESAQVRESKKEKNKIIEKKAWGIKYFIKTDPLGSLKKINPTNLTILSSISIQKLKNLEVITPIKIEIKINPKRTIAILWDFIAMSYFTRPSYFKYHKLRFYIKLVKYRGALPGIK